MQKKHKKRKRRTSSISRHSRGANNKSIRPGAQKSSFPPASLTSNAVPTVQQTPKVGAQQQQRRDVHLLQMKLRYEQKKNARTSQKIQQLSYGINNLQADQDNMIIMHKKEQQQLVAIQQSIEKDNKVLKDRIERWQKFSSKKDEEIYKIKLSAARRIAALERKSLMQLSQQKALQYRSERSHMKSVVALQNEVNRVNRDAEKMLSWLKEECKEKVETAE